MREYIEKRGLRFSRAQLDLLVPAFDKAWDAIKKRAGFFVVDADEPAMKDRLAKIIVDLVIKCSHADPQRIADDAVRLVLTN